MSLGVKFGRDYQLKVRGAVDVHTFNFPTTITFDVVRDLTPNANIGNFSLVNINRSARDDIFLDRTQVSEYREVELSVGYRTLPLRPIIFKGNMRTAYSEKQGGNIMTKINAYDGGYAIANSFVSISRPKSWNFNEVTQSIIKSMARVNLGTVTPQTISHTRGVVFNGSAWSQLQRLADPSGSFVFIDKEVVNLLSQEGIVATAGGILVIESATGLTNLPSRLGHQVTAQTILEPRFGIGELAILNSILNPKVNGTYKIIGLHHYGTISGVESGDALTDFLLLQSGPQANL